MAPCIGAEPRDVRSFFLAPRSASLKNLSTIDACSTMRTMCYTKGDTTVRYARYDNAGDVTYFIECNIHSNAIFCHAPSADECCAGWAGRHRS